MSEQYKIRYEQKVKRGEWKVFDTKIYDTSKLGPGNKHVLDFAEEISSRDDCRNVVVLVREDWKPFEVGYTKDKSS